MRPGRLPWAARRAQGWAPWAACVHSRSAKRCYVQVCGLMGGHVEGCTCIGWSRTNNGADCTFIKHSACTHVHMLVGMDAHRGTSLRVYARTSLDRLSGMAPHACRRACASSRMVAGMAAFCCTACAAVCSYDCKLACDRSCMPASMCRAP